MRQSVHVLDAAALLAYVRREEGWQVVADAVAQGACYAHGVSLFEAYYQVLRAAGRAAAQSLLRDVTAAGVVPREDMDPELWQDASDIHARFHIPTGDCFCIALGRRVGGTVLTADRKDFGPVAKAGACRVRFIR